MAAEDGQGVGVGGQSVPGGLVEAVPNGEKASYAPSLAPSSNSVEDAQMEAGMSVLIAVMGVVLLIGVLHALYYFRASAGYTQALGEDSNQSHDQDNDAAVQPARDEDDNDDRGKRTGGGQSGFGPHKEGEDSETPPPVPPRGPPRDHATGNGGGNSNG